MSRTVQIISDTLIEIDKMKTLQFYEESDLSP